MDKRGLITFQDYRVNKVFFQVNEEYNGEEVNIAFKVDANFEVSENNDQMTVILKTEIFPPQDGVVYPFLMEVEVKGFFQKVDDSQENIMNYAKNATAILFPYVRSIVSTYTASANVTPLILPTINVNKLLEETEEQ